MGSTIAKYICNKKWWWAQLASSRSRSRTHTTAIERLLLLAPERHAYLLQAAGSVGPGQGNVPPSNKKKRIYPIGKTTAARPSKGSLTAENVYIAL